MYKAFYVIAALSVFTVQAEARPHHRLHRIQYLPQSVALQAGGERVVGSRPAGCPNRFCGCEASLYKFGRIIPGLNLASNWRRFPRSAPASGMAAVRSGHVMILEQHIAGDVWLDGRTNARRLNRLAHCLARPAAALALKSRHQAISSCAWFWRQAAGGTPTALRKARLNAASDS
jgi:hypothetical protein